MQPGTQLGHYEILSPLGKGGMGEVWRARDSKLGREVAIKTLPEEFAKDEERLARFEREAKLLASLNHPNIAAIYGLEEDNDTRFLVLELVEGDTLAERLKRGAIPVEESLTLAIQIAEALEAAHEKGVIHRDLKPANIKVTPDGKIKVLDFGLAKSVGRGDAGADLSGAQTVTAIETEEGFLRGTPAYLSPQQLRGEEADRQADVWAFGCVLYEMLAGTRPFRGDTLFDMFAKIRETEPDWDKPPLKHPTIRQVLGRCLEKNPKDRWHDIADVRIDIERIADRGGLHVPGLSGQTGGPFWRRAAPLLVASMVVTGIVVGAVAWVLDSEPPRQPVRFTVSLPSNVALSAYTPLAMSPDGGRIVYGVSSEGQLDLYLQSFDQLEPTLLAESAGYPFFSHDGAWVGYLDIPDSTLSKVSILGGPAAKICELQNPFRFTGASWGPDETIIFAGSTGLLRVPAAGGVPEALTTPNPGEQHHWPEILPDGRAVLFTISSEEVATDDRIAVLNLETGSHEILIENGSHPRFAATGHIVYELDGSLRAAPFVPDQLEVIGDPVAVLDGLAIDHQLRLTKYGISRNGSLVYVSGGSGGNDEFTHVWVDRQGNETPLTAPRRTYLPFKKISPDGTKVAVSIATSTEDSDVWIWNLTEETMMRLTFDPGYDMDPIWTAAGDRVVFMSLRDGEAYNLFWKSADGTGEVERLTRTSPNTQNLGSISPDDKTLFFTEVGTNTRADLRLVPIEGDGLSEVILQTEFNEFNPEISPDGRWLAYVSSESNQLEVYVSPFPDFGSGKWQISTDGGMGPRWGPDQGELFYWNRKEQRLMAVPIRTDDTFAAGSPEGLFSLTPYYHDAIDYDTVDGQRFLLTKRVITSDETPVRLDVVLNWFNELKERVPVP